MVREAAAMVIAIRVTMTASRVTVMATAQTTTTIKKIATGGTGGLAISTEYWCRDYGISGDVKWSEIGAYAGSVIFNGNCNY